LIVMAKKNNMLLWLAGGVGVYLIYKNSLPPVTVDPGASPAPAAAVVPASALSNMAANLSSAVVAIAAPLKQMISSPVVTQYVAPPIPVTQTISIPAPIPAAPVAPPVTAATVYVAPPVYQPAVIEPLAYSNTAAQTMAMEEAEHIQSTGMTPGNKNFGLPSSNMIMGMKEMGGC
jgi:hypothetical protein